MQTVLVRGRVYNYSYTIGRASAAGGVGFGLIRDLARGQGRLLYVVNRAYYYRANDHVTMLTMDEEWIGDIGSPGEGDGQFIWPSAIATDSEGNVYVADEWLHRITIFDKDGKFLGKWGNAGSRDGQLNGPAGLAFDGENNLYVTDALNHRVQKFTRDGSFLLKWGREGSRSGEFNRPWGITVDSHGHVYVADWHNERVQKFSADGQYLATFGFPDSGPGERHLPSDVAVDKDGDVYVVDWWNHRVEVFDSDGTPLTSFVGDAERLSKWAQAMVDANPDHAKGRLLVKSLEPSWRFHRPIAITIDPDGKLLIADSQRARIQIYQKEQNWVEPPHNL